MLSIAQLRTPPTRSEITAWLIQTLRDLGFQTTGWQPGRIQHTMLHAVATVAAGFAQLGSALVTGGFNSTASGAGLTLFSTSRFGNTRNAAIKTQGPFTLTNTATVPYSIAVGSLVFSDNLGVEFQNTQAITLNASSTNTVNVEAILAGASGNIQNSATISLITPLAGVSVTNPSPGTDGDGNVLPWYSIQTGVDEETDKALRDRNASQWGLLAVEKTSTAFEHLALGLDAVRKVTIVANNPRGPGTVDVYLASDSAVLSTGDMETAQAAFAEYTFGTDSAWPPAITDAVTFPSTATMVYCRQPATLELTITGAVYYDPNYTEAQIKASLTTALDDLVKLAPIGGYDYSPGPSNVITLGDIVQTMETTVGVRTVTLTAPAGNITVSNTALVTSPSDWFTGRLTFAAVTS
jgi:uncharacterized phage protein gp47/JayE